MPKGKKTAAAPTVDPNSEPKKRGPKPGTKRKTRSVPVLRERQPGPARFGVFDDGSIELRLANCKGRMTQPEASQLLAFIEKLRS